MFDIFDSTAIQPTAGTTWTADVTATAGMTLVGRATSRSTGAAMPGVTVEAWRNIRIFGWVLARSAVTSAYGTYSMGVLPGPYRIRAVGLDGRYVEQWNGGAASLDAATDLLVPTNTGATCDFRLSLDALPPVTTPTVATCAIDARPAVVRYGGTASVTGTLTVASGGPTGLVVQLERSTDGTTFQSTGATAPVDATGAFRLSATLTRTYYFRVRSIETSDVAAAVSSPVLVRAKASIPQPLAPSTTYSWRTIKVSGTLRPSHASGNRVIQIRCFRYEHGTWVWRRSVWASSRAGKTASTYTANLRLSRGTWRICARHADSSHYLTDSAYRSVRVR
jgi:hypothetical protein